MTEERDRRVKKKSFKKRKLNLGKEREELRKEKDEEGGKN
jgi:hypothetical protein